MKQLSEKKLIKLINDKYPNAKAVPLSEFYGDDSEGIWFRGSENYLDDTRLLFEYYDYNNQCHPKIAEILDKAGWFWEPYDSGTLLAYPQ